MENTLDFTHLDKNGRANMVNVGEKQITSRTAQAEAKLRMQPETLRKLLSSELKKGDALATARIAGIMAAKRTWELIPLCHILNLTKVAVDFEKEPDRRRIRAVCTVRCTGRTGVEMEALTGVTAALLTVYDMCKAVDRSMEISDIHLVHKEGGKSGIYDRQKQEETE